MAKNAISVVTLTKANRITIPRNVRDRLSLSQGDMLILSESNDGTIVLSKLNSA